jgi:hypothetical protein
MSFRSFCDSSSFVNRSSNLRLLPIKLINIFVDILKMSIQIRFDGWIALFDCLNLVTVMST